MKLWKRVISFFGNKLHGEEEEKDSDISYYRDRYKNKLFEYKNSVIENIKEKNFTSEELKKELGDFINFFTVNEKLNLYEARTMARAKWAENQSARETGWMTEKLLRFMRYCKGPSWKEISKSILFKTSVVLGGAGMVLLASYKTIDDETKLAAAPGSMHAPGMSEEPPMPKSYDLEDKTIPETLPSEITLPESAPPGISYEENFPGQSETEVSGKEKNTAPFSATAETKADVARETDEKVEKFTTNELKIKTASVRQELTKDINLWNKYKDMTYDQANQAMRGELEEKLHDCAYKYTEQFGMEANPQPGESLKAWTRRIAEMILTRKI